MQQLEFLGQYWNPTTQRAHLLGRGGDTVCDLTPHLSYPSIRDEMLKCMQGTETLSTVLEGAPFPTAQAVLEAEKAQTTVRELLQPAWQAAQTKGDRMELAALDVEPDPFHAHLMACILPPRAMAFGVTYENSAFEREAEGKKQDYVYVYKSTKERQERCEVFIKGTRAHHFYGPRGNMGLRSDVTNSIDAKGRPSKRVQVLSGIEPELAAVTYSDGRILGYTLANDVSGNRIENESILYLFQAKYFIAGTGVGPWLWLSDEQDNPGISFAVVVRDDQGRQVFTGEADSRRISMPIKDLVAQAGSHNPLYPGELFLTGTDIAPNEAAKVVQPGWRVEITSQQLGTFSHGAQLVGAKDTANLNYHELELGTRPRHRA